MRAEGEAGSNMAVNGGSRQVTYHGRPLYLFDKDAYLGGASAVGTQGIYGAGAVTTSGVFNTIPPLP